jgi:hypothetical protein
MKKILDRKSIIEVVIIFIISLTPLLWYRGDSIMVGHDNTYPLNAPAFFTNRLYTWTDSIFGYDQSLIMGTTAIHLWDTLPSWLGFPVQTGQQIVYVMWFFLIGLSAYILASYIDRTSTAFKVTAVLLYQFNFFILQAWWIGEKSKFSVYVALPLLVTIYLGVFDRRLSVVTGILLAALTTFFFNGGGVFGLPLFGGLLIAIGILVLYVCGYLAHKRDTSSLTRFCLFVLGHLAGCIVLNSYYILPAASRIFESYQSGLAGSGGTSGLLEWTNEISIYTSFLNLIRMQGIAEWYDNPYHPYSQVYLKNPFFMVMSFVWPALVVLSLLFVKKVNRRYIIPYVSLVYVVGLIFAAGTHRPLGFIYEFLLTYVPGFSIFRTPYFKFAPAVFFATSFLIALYIRELKKPVRTVAFILLSAFILLYHYPYFSVDFFSWRPGYSTRLSIPSYVNDFARWYQEEKDDTGRVLMVPPNNARWSFETYNWGYLSLTPLLELYGSYPVVANNIRLTHDERVVTQLVYDALLAGNEKEFNRVAQLLGIKYVVVRKDYATDDIFIPELHEMYERSFNSFSQKMPVQEFGDWKLYALSIPDQPLLYTAENVTVVQGPSSEDSVQAYLAGMGEKNHTVTFDGEIPQNMRSNNMLIPTCITCGYIFRPLVTVPERSIVPGSIFYPIVRYKERQQVKNISTPHEIVSTHVGLTLKRIGELRTIKDRKLAGTREVLQLLTDELTTIEKVYDDVVSFEEKLVIAPSIQNYISEELTYLETLDFTGFFGPKDKVFLYEIMGIMHSLKEKTSIFDEDYQSGLKKTFKLEIPETGEYRVLLKDEEWGRQGGKVGLIVDDKSVDTQFGQGELREIASVPFYSGEHVITLVRPAIENVMPPFKQSTKQVEGWNCFDSTVEVPAPPVHYKLSFVLPQQDINNYQLYIQQRAGGIVYDEKTVQLYSSNTHEYTDKISVYDPIRGLTLVMCTSDLSRKSLPPGIITMNSVVEYPLVLIEKSDRSRPPSNVTFTKQSPTDYIVSIATTKPTILIFNQTYDDRWKLEQFDHNHIKANVYANGWIIDRPGTYNLRLEYVPQRYFERGILISAVSFVFSIVTLIWVFLKKRLPFVG